MNGENQIMQLRMHLSRGKLSPYTPHLISTPALADCPVTGGLAVSVGAAGALGGGDMVVVIMVIVVVVVVVVLVWWWWW